MIILYIDVEDRVNKLLLVGIVLSSMLITFYFILIVKKIYFFSFN